MRWPVGAGHDERAVIPGLRLVIPGLRYVIPGLRLVIPGLTGNLKNVIPGLRYVIPGLTRNLLAVLAVSLAVSCGGDEPLDPTPTTPITPVTPAKDTNAPTITVSKSTVNVIAGPAVTISDSELKVGDLSVATWKDDKSATCTVALTFTPAEGSAKTLNS